jgi:2-oxoglutarate ferredoxin oxidoreductase subunit alpha
VGQAAGGRFGLRIGTLSTMSRISVKIVGASGQGINSIGEIVAKGLKRSGYCVFGYREYPSLIKGGHASYQLDISDEVVRSTETKVNVLIALNHHGLVLNMREVKENGVVLHVTAGWQFSERDQQLIKEQSLQVIYCPVEDVLNSLGAKAILSNVVLTAVLWKMLNQNVDTLKSLIERKFAKKQSLLAVNRRCIDAGYSFVDPKHGKISVAPPPPQKAFSSHLLITGSQAMGLGAIHAGVRVFAGYPMTPASPLLSFIAELEGRTHMVVKQAEDEITAAQIVSGAMYMGTRALTATSGAGVDLMSETVSLNGMIENPTVIVLAQRPGPATGLPTWTAQSDLLQAVNAGHGEFARCVLSVSDSQDAFDLLPIAFNIAELYQISVFVLTEKQIAEGLYTQKPFDLATAEIDRGRLVTDPARLQSLKSTDRYDPHAEGGISPRWLPGCQAATYCAQGDEHDCVGDVNETSSNAKRQMEKRMRKCIGLKASLPEPRLSWTREGTGGPDWVDQGEEIELLLVGWGSTGNAIHDVMRSEELGVRRIAYLHYTYLWPLRTQRLQTLAKTAKRIVLVEQNYQGQLGLLIKMDCGLDIWDKILKYDGRPFFYDELLTLILEKCDDESEVPAHRSTTPRADLAGSSL